jgi:hypothetical protein
MRADPVRSRNAHQKTQPDGRNAQRAVRSHRHRGLSEPKRELLTLEYLPAAACVAATDHDEPGRASGESQDGKNA